MVLLDYSQCPLILFVPFVSEWDFLFMRSNLSTACVRRLLRIVLGLLWLSSLLGKSPGGNSQRFHDAWKMWRADVKCERLLKMVLIDSSPCPLIPCCVWMRKGDVTISFFIFFLIQIEAKKIIKACVTIQNTLVFTF